MKSARPWKIPELETKMLFAVKHNRTKWTKANKPIVTIHSSCFSLWSHFFFFNIHINFGYTLTHMAENLAEILHFNHSINTLRYESYLSFSSKSIVVHCEWPTWCQMPTPYARCGLKVESYCSKTVGMWVRSSSQRGGAGDVQAVLRQVW